MWASRRVGNLSRVQMTSAGIDPAGFVAHVTDDIVRGAIDAGLQGALVDPYDAHPDYDEAPRFSSVASLAAALVAG